MPSKAPTLKQAWDKWERSHELARQAIEASARFNNPAHRAQGYYALVEAQAMAYNWVVAPRLNHPRIHTHTSWATYMFTLAGNCPDFVYSIMPLDGRYTYHLRGRYGDVCMLLLQVLNLPMGVEGSQCIGNHEFSPTITDSTEVDIVLSATPQPGHWVPLDGGSDYNMVVLRRLMLDWEDDPGELEITMVGEMEDYDELSETAVARRIEMAADFGLAVIQNWALGLVDFTMKLTDGRHNTWGPVPGEMMEAIAGSATCNYAFLIFDLKPDEALLIELEEPVASAYWSLQVLDVWCKSLDYMHEQTDLNMKSAHRDADGIIRAVISQQDPGLPNWLNPMGRHEGLLALRNYHSKSFKDPTAKLINVAELQRHLPAQAELVSEQTRAAAVSRRRPAILKLYRG